AAVVDGGVVPDLDVVAKLVVLANDNAVAGLQASADAAAAVDDGAGAELGPSAHEQARVFRRAARTVAQDHARVQFHGAAHDDQRRIERSPGHSCNGLQASFASSGSPRSQTLFGNAGPRNAVSTPPVADFCARDLASRNGVSRTGVPKQSLGTRMGTF